jgi:hypothetical protein
MPEDRVAMWPNKARDLVSIGAVDYGELYRSVHNSKEVRNLASGGTGVDFGAGVPLTPAPHPSLQLITGYVAGVLLQHSDS